jgi:hypothetical protein
MSKATTASFLAASGLWCLLLSPSFLEIDPYLSLRAGSFGVLLLTVAGTLLRRL